MLIDSNVLVCPTVEYNHPVELKGIWMHGSSKRNSKQMSSRLSAFTENHRMQGFSWNGINENTGISVMRRSLKIETLKSLDKP